MADYYNPDAGGDVSLFNEFGGGGGGGNNQSTGGDFYNPNSTDYNLYNEFGSDGGNYDFSGSDFTNDYIDFTNSDNSGIYNSDWFYGDDSGSLDLGGGGGSESDSLFSDISLDIDDMGEDDDLMFGGILDDRTRNPMDRMIDLYERQYADRKQAAEDKANRSWWEKASDSPAVWNGLLQMFNFGMKEYQRQEDQERADEQSDKNFEREKELMTHKEDLYERRYNMRYGGGGGGGAAPPADTSGGFKYVPGVKTGTFQKK